MPSADYYCEDINSGHIIRKFRICFVIQITYLYSNCLYYYYCLYHHYYYNVIVLSDTRDLGLEHQ